VGHKPPDWEAPVQPREIQERSAKDPRVPCPDKGVREELTNKIFKGYARQATGESSNS
jgi:hypothetical protein